MITEDKIEEVNRVLRGLDSAACDETVLRHEGTKGKNRLLIGSGEDCQIVLFGNNYRRLITYDDCRYD